MTVPDIVDIISKELPNTNSSGEMHFMINIVCKVIQTQFDFNLTKIDNSSSAKEKHVDRLETKISALKEKITRLETTVDDMDQYERRDMVLMSGPALPDESNSENASDLTVNNTKHRRHVDTSHSDISNAHRLGP